MHSGGTVRHLDDGNPTTLLHVEQLVGLFKAPNLDFRGHVLNLPLGSTTAATIIEIGGRAIRRLC
jgi:hypothetical protein